MPFNYQAQPLPILEPGQMNPFHQALQTGLNTFQQGIKAAYLPSQLRQEYERQQIENQYAPLKTLSQAASQLTYSNLMGPQFLAKIMSNPSLLANIPDEQKEQLLNMVVKSGSNQPSLQNIPQLGTSVSDILNGAKQSSGLNILNQQSPMENQSQVQQQPIIQPMQLEQNKKPTFTENVAAQERIVSQGKEEGKIRAEQSGELSNIVGHANEKQLVYDELAKTITSPIFQEIRKIPIAQQHEIGWYSKFGTKEQQEVIGNFLEQINRIVVSGASEFKGAFRVGEQGLLNKMKVNPSDSIDVAIGKLQSASYFNKMLSQRSNIAARYMDEQHISKSKALELADKEINGNEIKKSIYNQLHPQPTESDITHMAEKYKISTDEVKKRLREKGIIK